MVVTTSRVRIHGDGMTHVVEIDGHQVQNSTEALALSIDTRTRLPQLTLQLALREAPDVDTAARVLLDEQTVRALVAMGWTPPEGGE